MLAVIVAWWVLTKIILPWLRRQTNQSQTVNGGNGNGDDGNGNSTAYNPAKLANKIYWQICWNPLNMVKYPELAREVTALSAENAKALGEYYKDKYGASLYECFMDEWDTWEGDYQAAADHLNAAGVT